MSQKYGGRVAICEEHTRHIWCAGSSFSDLQIVDTSCLVGYLLLLVCLSRALYLRRLWCRVELSRKFTEVSKMAWSSTIETKLLGWLSLRWNGRSNIPLWLQWPIVLRSLDILLLNGSNCHLLLPRLLLWRPGRYLISQSGALRSTYRRTSCDLGFSFLKAMKTDIFLHCDSIIN